MAIRINLDRSSKSANWIKSVRDSNQAARDKKKSKKFKKSEDLPELLTLLAASEYMAKQGGNQGTPAPSEGTPEHAHRGKNWDYVSSTPAPEGARTLHTAGGRAWWQAGGGEGEQPQQAEEGITLSGVLAEEPEKDYVYHVTPTSNLDEILQQGLGSTAMMRNDFGERDGEYVYEFDEDGNSLDEDDEEDVFEQPSAREQLLYFVTREPGTPEYQAVVDSLPQSHRGADSTNLRVKKTALQKLQDSRLARNGWVDRDALIPTNIFISTDEHSSFKISPEDIEYQDSETKQWHPLSQAEKPQQAEEKTPPPEFKEFFEADTGKIDKNPELVKKLAEVIAQDREQTLGSAHIESVKEPVVGWIEGRFEMIQGVRAVIAQMRGEEINKEAIREVLLTSGAKLGLTKAVVTDEYIEGQIERGLDEIGEYDNPGATAKLLEAEQKYAEKRTRELFGDTITVYRAFRGSEVRGMADRIKSGETVEMNLLPGTSFGMDENAAIVFSVVQHPGADHMVWKQEVDAADVLFAWYSNPSFLTGHAYAQPYQKEVVINPKNTSITLTKDDFVSLPGVEMSAEEKRQRFVKLYEMQKKRDSIVDKDEAIKELAPDQYKLWIEQGTFTAEGKRLSGSILDAWEDVEGRAEQPDQYEDEDDYDENNAYSRVWDAFPELANMDDWDRMWKKLDELGMKEFGDMSPEEKKERGLE